MGFRYRRRIKVAPGVRVNVSKTGTSLSLGGRGATYNINRDGGRASFSLPGTGLSYTGARSGKAGDLAILVALFSAAMLAFVISFRLLRWILRLPGALVAYPFTRTPKTAADSAGQTATPSVKSVLVSAPFGPTGIETIPGLSATPDAHAEAGRAAALATELPAEAAPPRTLRDREDMNEIVRRIAMQNAAAAARARAAGPAPRRQRRSPVADRS
ncbi:DUF4236 domain-containing protein (plasmid) [Acidiphilium multivorum]|uniref:DUF4236 domain-containing protein n=1 Tax=Acidiphilium TaxID=522 RepID=UPI00157A7859|nr:MULTISPECIES: DUF4236 domain-containing protein [Acidiphilium]UNC16339.1 DUF4236 domain-containing protein [Acidiphilium multivorum]